MQWVAVALVAVVPVATLLALRVFAPSPDFRLECQRVASDRDGLTLAVAKAAHLAAGTAFTINYGDGTSDGTLSRGRARLTHAYPKHGVYEITARVHLPSNELDSYRNTCHV